jgi:hypothetical protein
MCGEKSNFRLVVASLLLTMALSACASDDLRGMLVGHPATHWGPPEGKGASDRQTDLASCNYPAASYFSCMKRMGYRAIELRPGKQLTEEEKSVIEKDNTVQTGLFAIDQRTGDIFVGDAKSQLGSSTAALSLKGLRTNVSCKGNAKLDTVTANAQGSTGSAKLLCNDGRVITASFVYETQTKGFGVGNDRTGAEYRFIFGEFKADEKTLKEAFRKSFKDVSPLPKRQGA